MYLCCLFYITGFSVSFRRKAAEKPEDGQNVSEGSWGNSVILKLLNVAPQTTAYYAIVHAIANDTIVMPFCWIPKECMYLAQIWMTAGVTRKQYVIKNEMLDIVIKCDHPIFGFH